MRQSSPSPRAQRPRSPPGTWQGEWRLCRLSKGRHAGDRHEPFSGKADRGFAIVADIQQGKAFPSIPDPFDTRGRTPDPGAVALIVTYAHDCIAVRAHRHRLAIEFAARGEDEFFDTVDPLRSGSLAGWLVLPADNNASICVDSHWLARSGHRKVSEERLPGRH